MSLGVRPQGSFLQPPRPYCSPVYALGDGHNAVHIAQDRLFDKFSVDHHQPRIGFLEGPDNPPCSLNRSLIRRENRIERGDLLGVDGSPYH